MKIINLNPDTEIGASAWLVDLDGNRLLMDAGTHPKREGRESLPLYSLIANDEVDCIAMRGLPASNFRTPAICSCQLE